MKRNLLFILVIAALLLGACATAPAATAEPFGPIHGQLNPVGGAANEQKSAPAAPANLPSIVVDAAGNAVVSQDRIVIQNADLSIVVKDPEAKMLEIGAMAQRLGGFVVSSNMGKTPIGDNVSVSGGTISIRVPAKDLDTALNEIKANTVEVQTENRSGQDVTDKYVDLQSQLKAKQAAADKFDP